LISTPDRKKYGDLIDGSVQNGARQKLACELVGITPRPYQRWNKGGKLSEDRRLYHEAPVHNKLSDVVKQARLGVINPPEYSLLTPPQIVPT